MIFNLILKVNLKMNSNSKLVLNLILNLKMFHVKHENEFTKAHLWAENYTTAIQFCQELFSKNFLAYLPPESQKEKAPRGEPSEL